MSTFKESDTSASNMRLWKMLPRLIAFVWSLGRSEVLLIALFLLIGGLLPIAGVALLRLVVDSAVDAVANDAPLSPVAAWLGLLVGTGLVDKMLLFLDQELGQHRYERLRVRAQETLISKAGFLSLMTFERPEFYDRLRRAQDGVDNNLSVTIRYVLWIPTRLITSVGLLAYLGSANLILPIVMVAGLVPVYLVSAHYSRRLYDLRRRHTPDERRLDYLGDLMTGREAAAEVRLFGLGSYLLDKRQRLFAQLRDQRLKLARHRAVNTVAPALGDQLTYAVVILGLVVLIAGGDLTIGYFVALLGASERFRSAVGQLFFYTTGLNEHLHYLRDLFGYMDIEDERTPPDTAARPDRPMPAIAGPRSPLIELDNVTFSYPGSSTQTLAGVSLVVRPKERIALFGENGAGKTTLAKLVLGLYSPSGGRIVVDGVDLKGLDPSDWRRRGAAVFQDYVRFEVTARENIAFGNLEALDDTDAIEAAAAMSGASEVVAGLTSSYDTVLGRAYDEQGQDLSTGQWQRLAIARAYFRDASVLVLDEPTAALDAKAEVEVYQSFTDMSHGKSVILISHRLGCARLADRVVFLDAGRIVEEGTHDELLARGGRYAEMYELQAAWYR